MAVKNFSSQTYISGEVVSKVQSSLLGFTGYNSGADQFIQVHDSNTVPADGATPKIMFKVYSGSNFSIDFSPERSFVKGIYICNSSTGETKILGGADCWFDVQHI